MKIIMMLILGMIVVSCTNNQNVDRMSRGANENPIIYRNYIQEGSDSYLKAEQDADEVYYWNYRGEE